MSEIKLKGTRWDLVPGMVRAVICLLVMSGAGLNAGTLWNNGVVSTNTIPTPFSDSLDNGVGPFTMFDNFTVSPIGWVVQGFDITDFFVSTPTTDYKSTTWSIWSGDPLTSTGKLIATGTALLGVTASLTNITGSCGVGFTCVEMITVTGLSVNLNTGTYYLGTTNNVASTSDETFRAYAAGHSGNPGDGWEQSNGTITGSSWTNGNTQTVMATGDTAFDINGVFAPEPSTLILMSLALVGLGYKLRRRAV